jgi:hypothetical protein
MVDPTAITARSPMVTPGRIVERPTQTSHQDELAQSGLDGKAPWDVRIENGHQVPNQAIVTDHDAVIGHDRGINVDEDTLA